MFPDWRELSEDLLQWPDHVADDIAGEIGADEAKVRAVLEKFVEAFIRERNEIHRRRRPKGKRDKSSHF